ncbi:MAG: type II CRISPR RNA-guided endonuclease Cas9 [Eubacteriales bacterium]|nr:type II CRISPR RNA-guided endonuclease Cas9 [Eubacteriales bacterium]
MVDNYYLGLDMGTSSVGWAVTDMDYKLVRRKGKDLWGVREFDEAKTSKERRQKRSARRRRQREQVRVALLKSYFHDAITSVDPYFFIRLDNSKYFYGDKDKLLKNKNSIFDDKNFSDKDYYKEYPTIFHLRKELIENSSPHDCRLVYLAIINMFKHRGHFLNEGFSDKVYERTEEEIFSDLIFALKDTTNISLKEVDAKKMINIIANRRISRKEKSKEICSLLCLEKRNSREKEVVNAICGLKADMNILFDLDYDKDEDLKIEFNSSWVDDQEKVLNKVGEEIFTVIETMKEFFDIAMLNEIMAGKPYLSYARVDSYDKHKKDLECLKKVIKKYKKSEYNNLFRNESKGSYSAYVKSVNSSGNNIKQRRIYQKKTKENLYNNLEELLKGIESIKSEDVEDVKLILSEIENRTFLPKQLTSQNGVIPNQIHKRELEKILQNAEKYLSFLCEKDEIGQSVSEKILQLFSFRIPYYVGPTSIDSEKNNGNGWVVRNIGEEKGLILPWNIDKKINLKETSEMFISKLVRNCTYINNEQVLPKESLLYERYCVLDEINNIKIDGEKISVEVKQKIYNDLFKKGKKVTFSSLTKYLINNGLLNSKNQLSGIDNNIKNSLSSYGKFHSIFGDKIEKDSEKEKIEKIIFWCTVYGQSKKFLLEQIEKHYPDISSEQKKRISSFKMKGWCSLSKEFLYLKGCNKENGEVISLIDAMWQYNLNLEELINSDSFTFSEELENKQNNVFVKELNELKAEDLDEMYFSGPVKRMVWQTILVLKEVIQVMGHTPKKIFVEVTRSDQKKGDKGRTDSRAKQLLDIYKNIKDKDHNWKQEINTANDNGTIRSKKMYLYFKQMGRDMYTGEPIHIDDLLNDNIYDIDHIYPRHFIKDDDLDDNLVLVKKIDNLDKKDKYPLDSYITSNNNVRNLWQMLRENKLINDEKYKRLTGKNPLSDEQKAKFIKRQLVETNQGIKGIIDIIKEAVPKSEIVYSKAKNVSDFRQQFNRLKSRSVNDFHHAHDAYLNIVVGNTYDVKFTKNPKNFIKEYDKDQDNNKYNLSRMFDWDVRRGNTVAWIAGESGTIKTVKTTLDRNTPLITRFSFEHHGAIADETLYSATNAKDSKQTQGYIPLKLSDERMQNVTKYGGFKSVTTSYFTLLEYDGKKIRVRSIEAVPTYMNKKIENDPKELEKYFTNFFGYKNISVRIPKIRLQSLIRVNGYPMYLSGRTGEQCKMKNAVSMCIKYKWVEYIKKVENFIQKKYVDKEITKEKNIELFDILIEKHATRIFEKRPNSKTNSMTKKLKDGKEKFENSKLEKQLKVLSEVLKLTSIGETKADLTFIGEPKNSGILLINKKISKKKVLLVHQSVTGLYEKSIDLNKV